MHFLSRETVTETAVVSGDPGPAPALIALNILNALNWKKKMLTR